MVWIGNYNLSEYGTLCGIKKQVPEIILDFFQCGSFWRGIFIMCISIEVLVHCLLA